MKKFNFLAPRTERVKAEANLQRRFPNRSPHWIGGSAQRVAPPADITAELQAPGQFQVLQRRSK